MQKDLKLQADDHPRVTYLQRTRSTATEALRLRTWAVQNLLCSADEPIPLVSANAWRVFLDWERCALLLQGVLGNRTRSFPTAVTAELREAALRESMWTLSARAQLKTVASLAATEGISVIVLKGTADVARGRDIQVTDVDVLATPDGARRLAQSLDSAGFLAGPRDGNWHLAARSISGGVNIEVHVAVTGFDTPSTVPWRSTRSIEGMEPLLMLDPADHAWTILCQATRKHPDRRMRIRDLYLVRLALYECSPEQREALERRTAGDPYRVELARMIGQALGTEDLDPESRRRLRRLYLLQSRAPRRRAHWMDVLWRRAVEGIAGGFVHDWKRRQRRRKAAGRSQATLLRRLVRPSAAVAAFAYGRLISHDEFLIAESIPEILTSREPAM